jgi:hypothetical protein
MPNRINYWQMQHIPAEDFEPRQKWSADPSFQVCAVEDAEFWLPENAAGTVIVLSENDCILRVIASSDLREGIRTIAIDPEMAARSPSRIAFKVQNFCVVPARIPVPAGCSVDTAMQEAQVKSVAGPEFTGSEAA